MRNAWRVGAVAAVALGTSAFGHGKAHAKASKLQDSQIQQEAGTGGAGMSDLSQAGPWTRKPTDEKKTKDEVQAFLKQEDELIKKNDFTAEVARVDFPVFMITDDSKGMPKAEAWSKDQYLQMMKPMMEKMKDATMSHKQTVTVLSDSLASYVDDYTLKTGGKSYAGRCAGVLVKKDGQWKWKTMTEAGWGNEKAMGTGGSGEPIHEDVSGSQRQHSPGGEREQQSPDQKTY